MRCEVVVVGAGPAGLQAALVLARARRHVVVVDAGEPRNAASAHLHGYLSRDGMDPQELLQVGRAEVKTYGGELWEGAVEAIERTAAGEFSVSLNDGRLLTTSAVLVATGLRDDLPDIMGVPDRWGRDVLHCPYCHGYEVRDSAIGVIGGKNRPFSVHQAMLVRKWSNDVVFFPNGIELTSEERERMLAFGVRISEGSVEHLELSDDRITGVGMSGGSVVPRTIIFIGPQFRPSDTLLKNLGCELGENGWVRIDSTGATSVPGVWASGNVVDSPAQIVSAAGGAYMAAVAVNHYLLAAEIDRAVASQRSYGDVFSNEMERRVSELVLGDRRHGL